MDLVNSLHIASSGMGAQSERLKIIAQNIANADNVGNSPDDEPYRRKVISFRNHFDRELGADRVEVYRIGVQKGELPKKYDPNHPAADPDGYITMPNVNPLIEMSDLREAQRSYEANVNVVEVTKRMLQQTIGILSSSV